MLEEEKAPRIPHNPTFRRQEGEGEKWGLSRTWRTRDKNRERLRRTVAAGGRHRAETKVGKGLSSATRTPPQEPGKKAVSTESEGEARGEMGSQHRGFIQHRTAASYRSPWDYLNRIWINLKLTKIRDSIPRCHWPHFTCAAVAHG